MTPLQFEQVFKLLDKDNSGYMEPVEMLDLFRAYETWLYEKEFQHAMEAVYQDQKPEIVKEKEAEAKKEKNAAKEAKAAKKIMNGEGDSSSEEGSGTSGSSDEEDEDKKNKDEHKAREFWNKALLLMSSP